MAAIHLLRSQISLLYSSKFKLLRSLISSLIIHNQHDQNPNFSRHFRPIHSITFKLSPESSLIDDNGASEELTFESSPRVWSTLSNPECKPTNSIKSVGSNAEEGSRNRVNRMYWVCADCGHSTAQWWRICKSCNKFGTLKKISVSKNETSENMIKSSWLPEHNAPVRLMDVNRGINHREWRIRLSGLLGLEVNTVLGGGIVPA